jgi:hypothetical protein
VFENEKARAYALKYFRDYVDLENEEVLAALAEKLKRWLSWSKEAYNYIREFVYEKTDPIYLKFKTEIDEYEEKNVAEKDRIIEEIPF